MKEFGLALEEILASESIRTNEMMKNHTTFRIGGPADYYVMPCNELELAAVIQLCRQQKMPYFLLGNGSNLLVSDNGYRGVVIAMGELWSDCHIQDNKVTAGAGILLSRLARQAKEASLTGLEFAAGIPGSLGGALVMNAGAYGSEMKDILISARVMNQEGQVETLLVEELELGYRCSCIPQKGYLVLEGTFLLQQGEKETVAAKMEELALERKKKQPLEYPSAGSTFKRPAGYYAGKLIDDAGLRGFQVGDAQISEKHCGFVVNRGQATAADVKKLCAEVQRQVLEKSGVTLEMEVKTLGEI